MRRLQTRWRCQVADEKLSEAHTFLRLVARQPSGYSARWERLRVAAGSWPMRVLRFFALIIFQLRLSESRKASRLSGLTDAPPRYQFKGA